MAQIKKGAIAGFPYAQVWRVDDDGYAQGQLTTPDSPGTDVTTSAYLLRDVKTAGFSLPANVKIDFTGGDKYLGSFMFGIASVDAFDFTTAYLDANVVALVTDSSVDQTTNADWSVFGNNEMNPTLPQCGVMLQTNFQSKESGTAGLNYWLNVIIPICQISPKPPQLAFQSEAPTTYTVQPSVATKWPNGDAFDSNQGFENNECVAYYIVTNNPLAITTYNADGIETTFTAGYRPISTVVTVNDTPNHFAVNGTPTALSSIVTTTGVATMSAAGSSADRNVLMYETQFVAI
jgi:hypothetical protein